MYHKRVMLLKEGLDVSWWNRIEIEHGNERQPIFDVRNNASIEQLIKINNDANMQVSLLDDISFDCFCKAS